MLSRLIEGPPTAVQPCPWLIPPQGPSPPPFPAPLTTPVSLGRPDKHAGGQSDSRRRIRADKLRWRTTTGPCQAACDGRLIKGRQRKHHFMSGYANPDSAQPHKPPDGGNFLSYFRTLKQPTTRERRKKSKDIDKDMGSLWSNSFAFMPTEV